jgi:hypothetical protein
MSQLGAARLPARYPDCFPGILPVIKKIINEFDVWHMDVISLFAFVGLLLSQIVAEYVAMLRTRTLKRKHKREWTYYAVMIPFKGMLAAAVVEHISSPARPGIGVVVAGSLLAAAGIIIRVRGQHRSSRSVAPNAVGMARRWVVGQLPVGRFPGARWVSFSGRGQPLSTTVLG